MSRVRVVLYIDAFTQTCPLTVPALRTIRVHMFYVEDVDELQRLLVSDVPFIRGYSNNNRSDSSDSDDDLEHTWRVMALPGAVGR